MALGLYPGSAPSLSTVLSDAEPFPMTMGCCPPAPCLTITSRKTSLTFPSLFTSFHQRPLLNAYWVPGFVRCWGDTGEQMSQGCHPGVARFVARWWVEIGDQLPNSEPRLLVPGHHSLASNAFRVLLFSVNPSWSVLKQVWGGLRKRHFQQGEQHEKARR